jgi:hypothetical protein
MFCKGIFFNVAVWLANIKKLLILITINQAYNPDIKQYWRILTDVFYESMFGSGKTVIVLQKISSS